MPKYKFQAKKMTGEEITGVREANDQFELARSVKEQGYMLVDFEEADKRGIKLSIPSFLDRVSLTEKMIFTKNLAVMIGAGLSISRAFEVLIKQAKKGGKLKKVLSQMASEITQGKQLSDCLKEHPKVFSPFYVAMVRSGEKSGKLEETLKLVADQLSKDSALIRKVRGALVYPAIIIVAMIGIAILMFYYVVPTLTSVFREVDMELPMSTKFVIWFSDSLVTNGMLIGAGFLAFILVCAGLLRNYRVKRMLASAFLHVPIFSSLIKKLNSARTTRTLATLVSSGINIVEALTVTAEVVQNPRFKKVLESAKEDIQKGSTIASSFKKDENVYPSLVGEMIAVGEETGELSNLLLTLAVFYEDEVSETTKDMATIIEPVLMIFIGTVVGFFAVAMMKPMYSMVAAF